METHLKGEKRYSESTIATFDSGHTVGGYAKHYFGEFKEIPMYFEDFNNSFKLAQEITKNLINEKTPTICEGAFKYENARCFADIVRPNVDGTIDIIEVKQASKVKPEHYNDMAFQYYVIKNCGYEISKISLMHVDTSYVRNGEIEPQKMFKTVDCTEEVVALQSEIPKKIAELIRYSEQKTEPEMLVGTQCSSPYECAYKEHCYKDIEEKIIVEEKPKGEEKLDKDGLQKFLTQLRYPLYFLDFETTLMEVIPPVDGSRPYGSGRPYQYSLHIQKSKDEDVNKLEHREFLADELNNETHRQLAERLCSDIPKDAQIVTYTHFERYRIIQLAKDFPDLSEHLLSLNENYIDLAIPFSKKYLRTPEMVIGKYNIKMVLPALFPEMVYSDLEVQDGSMAYETFKTLKSLSSKDLEDARKALLAYCKMDSFAMVKNLRELEERVKNSL